jgi:hypothetical protein
MGQGPHTQGLKASVRGPISAPRTSAECCTTTASTSATDDDHYRAESHCRTGDHDETVRIRDSFGSRLASSATGDASIAQPWFADRGFAAPEVVIVPDHLRRAHPAMGWRWETSVSTWGSMAPGWAAGSGSTRWRRSRLALPTTDREDSAIAAAAIIGESRRPSSG